MSVVFEYSCFVKTDDVKSIKDLLDDKKLREKHEDAVVTIYEETDEELYFDIHGHRCDQFWYEIRSSDLIKECKEWFFIESCDHDYGNYRLIGNLGEGEFSKNLYLSKARVQFEDISGSSSPIKTAISKIRNKKIKVKIKS